MSDIGVTFHQSSVASWQEWYRSLASGADDERHGALTIVGADNGAVITFDLSNLGLYSLYQATQGKSGATKRTSRRSCTASACACFQRSISKG